MEFEEIVVKESPGLCRCCLSEGCYKDLSSEYIWMNETEVYADMLLDCFDISISQHNDGPNGSKRLVCEVCITRLRDACNFKKQVLESEKKFVDMIGSGAFTPKVVVYEATMKSEIPVEEPLPEETEVEYLEDDMNFDDGVRDAEFLDSETDEPSASDDVPIASLKSTKSLKPKGARPKKPPTKVEKVKTKAVKTEEKPKSSRATAKGIELPSATMTSTKRNRLIKRNAVIILEHTTVVPFKYHRKKYLCFYCHKEFQLPKHFIDHTNTEHVKANVKSAVSYLRRDENVKIDVSLILCKLCNSNKTKKIDSLQAAIDHIKIVHNKVFDEEFGFGVIPYKFNSDTFDCALCDGKFQYFSKLNQHMNEHFGRFICELCGKSFLSQNRLRCHTLSHGSGFRCKECNETFDSLTLKNKHETEIHKKNKRLKCFYCSETFKNYLQRKRHHIAEHSVDIQEFLCPVCGKKFPIMSRMKIHLKEVHIREKNFSCTVCEQKFFSRTHVKKHMIKHFGERVHQCSVCNKSYSRKQALRDHMKKIHSNEKRFTCLVCSQRFAQNNSLRLHMKEHHPDSETA